MRRAKKIAFIVQDLCGQGAQYATAAVARALVQAGHQVEFLISPVHRDKVEKGDSMAFSLDERIKLIEMPSRHARYNILFIRRYLKTTDADAVLSTSGPYHKAHRLALVGLKTKCLNVQMDHGIIGWDRVNRRDLPAPRFLSRRWLRGRWHLSRFDRVFTVNRYAKEGILRMCSSYPREHIQVVYNPCIDELFFQKRNAEPSHPWLRCKDVPTFICAGAYYPYKDHMTLLRAMKRVADSGVKARAIIFGTGPLKDEYLRYIQENRMEDVVSVPGYTTNLPAEMRAADGYLMTSSWESFGIVVVEALASGLPVISTDAIGPAEILQSGRYGRLVGVGDDVARAEAIKAEVKNPSAKPTEESWRDYTAEKCALAMVESIDQK